MNSFEKELFENTLISLKLKGETKLINLKNIWYLEAFGDGTYIHMKKEVLESNKTLKYWDEKLGKEHFYQTHRSYIVALRHIKKLNLNM